MRVFLYALGYASEVHGKFARSVELPANREFVVDGAEERDRPLHCRLGWRSLTHPKLKQLLRSQRKPLTFAQHGDLVIVPDIATLGPFWRRGDRGLADTLRRGLNVVILETIHGRPIKLASPLCPEMLARLEVEAAAARLAYRQQRIRDALAATRARGTRVGRPPFGWHVDGGRLVPAPIDIETIRDICRWHDDFGWTLKAITEELAARGAKLACGRPWNSDFVSSAWRYGVNHGWARPLSRPWRFAKKRFAAN